MTSRLTERPPLLSLIVEQYKGFEVSDVRRSWDDAVAPYEELARDGDRSAAFLLDVARRLATTRVGSSLEAGAGEECLSIFVPEDCRPPQGTPWVAVVSEADELDYSQDEFGVTPADLDHACWRVDA